LEHTKPFCVRARFNTHANSITHIGKTEAIHRPMVIGSIFLNHFPIAAISAGGNDCRACGYRKFSVSADSYGSGHSFFRINNYIPCPCADKDPHPKFITPFSEHISHHGASHLPVAYNRRLIREKSHQFKDTAEFFQPSNSIARSVDERTDNPRINIPVCPIHSSIKQLVF